MSFRGRLDLLMQRIRRTVVAPTDPASDALLLERFVAARDQAAFELLLWRHGPMVLSVCRRMLRCEEDAEDAFQAAFLLLARKAASIRRREAVAGWLYQTACRVALRARAANVRRPVAVPPDAEPATAACEPDIVWRDLRPVLDEEVGRLPRKYRLAIILCYLQRRTHAEAAVELGCPRGTVGVRLQRARELLRKRLTRRGLALSAAALAVLAAERAAAAAVPAALVHAAVKASLLFALGKPLAGAASAQAASWTQGVLKAMFLSKLKTAAAVLLALGLLGTGCWLSLEAAAPSKTRAALETLQPAAAAASPGDTPTARTAVLNVPAQRDGIVTVIGSEIKEGENVPPELTVSIKRDGAEKKYRRLKVGDTVEEGQLLARLDDRLARLDVEVQEDKLEAAKAALGAALKVREDAALRVKDIDRLAGAAAISQQEMRAIRLDADRAEADVQVKMAAVKQAGTELKAAQTVLEMYEIRSPVRGVVKAVLKDRGEAVRALETVVQIEEKKE